MAHEATRGLSAQQKALGRKRLKQKRNRLNLIQFRLYNPTLKEYSRNTDHRPPNQTISFLQLLNCFRRTDSLFVIPSHVRPPQPLLVLTQKRKVLESQRTPAAEMLAGLLRLVRWASWSRPPGLSMSDLEDLDVGIAFPLTMSEEEKFVVKGGKLTATSGVIRGEQITQTAGKEQTLERYFGRQNPLLMVVFHRISMMIKRRSSLRRRRPVFCLSSTRMEMAIIYGTLQRLSSSLQPCC